VRKGVVPLRLVRRGRSSRGQGIVEFAIIAPLLILIVLGTIDFGRVLFSWIEVQNASREATAYAISNPTDTAGIAVHARQETSVQKQTGEGALVITTTCNRSDTKAVVPCNALVVTGLGSTVTVSVSEPFTFFTPIISQLFSGFSLGGSSTGFYNSPVGTAPTPTPTPSPVPTPTPTATPTPTPTPTPSPCTVPNFVGVKSNKVAGLWSGAGFVPANLTNNAGNGNPTIKGQSLGAGTTQQCATAKIIVN
jgi:Flp pilus assembly protein TadG